MTIAPKNELSPKHLQALELIKDGNHSYREIAGMVGFSEQHLYELIAGDTQSCGSSASLFAAEVDRITADRAKEIKTLSKVALKNCLCIFQEHTEKIKNKKKRSEGDLKVAVSIVNAIGKSTPNVEIGSFTYARGLSAEDIVSEFKRLRGLSANRIGVSGLEQGKPGEIPGLEEPGSTS
jgi:hypothetical protein